jgi:hypothetical protein
MPTLYAAYGSASHFVSEDDFKPCQVIDSFDNTIYYYRLYLVEETDMVHPSMTRYEIPKSIESMGELVQLAHQTLHSQGITNDMMHNLDVKVAARFDPWVLLIGRAMSVTDSYPFIHKLSQRENMVDASKEELAQLPREQAHFIRGARGYFGRKAQVWNSDKIRKCHGRHFFE